jgi:hypothetical protein
VVKAIAILVASLAVATLGYLIVIKGETVPGLDSDSPPSSTDNGVQAGPRSWNGKRNRLLNATIVYQGRTLTVQSVHYQGLNTRFARMAVKVSIPKEKGAIPRWVKPKRFVLVASDGRSWLPETRARVVGANVKIDLVYHRVPTGDLAAGLMTLSVRAPGSNYGLGFRPPDPPPGHRFGEKR